MKNKFRSEKFDLYAGHYGTDSKHEKQMYENWQEITNKKIKNKHKKER